MDSPSNKCPPKLANHKVYADWVRLLKLWEQFTDLDKKRQGPAVVISLSGKALDSVLELEDEKIASEDGIKNILVKLDTIYKKDELNEKFQDLEKFEDLKRLSTTSINDFIADFDRKYSCLKKHGTTISEDLLGFKLLKSANLPTKDEQLIKATVEAITYANIKAKIKAVYSNEDEKPSTSNHFDIKQEPTLYTKGNQHSDEDDYSEDNQYDDNQEPSDVFYVPNKQRRPYRSPNNAPFHRRPSSSGPSSSNNWRSDQQSARPRPDNPNQKKTVKGKNPSFNGSQTRCNICESINHWATQCPDRHSNEASYMINEIVLHNSDNTVLRTLVSETWSSAVLDCGATSTVCGKAWFEEYCNNLSEVDQRKITSSPGEKSYQFGDGKQVHAIKTATIPIKLGKHPAVLHTDVVDADIPLLLSKAAMKKANMQLDFHQDCIKVYGQEIPLVTTSNGLYSMPITKQKCLIENLEKSHRQESITLAVRDNKSNHEIAKKLHRSFAHPSSEKLIKLVNSAGPQWSENNELKTLIKQTTEECQTCKIFKKPPPRPVVALPMSSKFQEVVAMDLKFYQGKIILHLIDLFSRLSAAIIIPNKSRDTIIKGIFRIWISVYGTPERFLSDNGGEFCNSDFVEMCESLGITIHTTAAESPWSNGVVERNNKTLADMMDKIINDNNCSVDLALMWALSAKNSLQNVSGFTPYQLVLGCNPKLPATLSDDIPALSSKPVSDVIREHLQTLHSAREAFIASENSERIRRALIHNVRTSGEIKYLTGDVVLFKGNDSKEWHGPAIVVGQVSQQVILKHGGMYVRRHPCRLQLVKEASRTADHNPGNPDREIQIPAEQQNQIPRHQYENSDSEDEHSPNDVSIQDEQGTNANDELPVVANEATAPAPRSKQQDLKEIKPNSKVQYQVDDDTPWRSATVTSRGGKSSGKMKHWWNVEDSNGHTQAVEFSTIKDWNFAEDPAPNDDAPTVGVERVVDPVLLTRNKEAEVQAKRAELDEWKNKGVYTEIEDRGQDCMSLRWVVKSKIINGKEGIKARLCARGFEEEQDFRKDSPTCSREGVRATLSLIASKQWVIHSIDVKTAFLQGNDLERTVIVRPPKEAETIKVWLLKKCVYGLADASRYWYLKVCNEFSKIGILPSKLDQGIFYSHVNGVLSGIVILFVDDILWAGISIFEEKIEAFKSVVQIGSENSNAFTYVGIRLVQKDDMTIVIDQNTYSASLDPIPLDKGRASTPHATVSEAERRAIRGAVGQLNWLANITRPEISFQVSSIGSKIKDATVSDIKEVNKVIGYVKEHPTHITFPPLHLPSTRIVMYSDSSFNNLPKGGSQGAHIVFLVDKHNHSCPIAWRSNRIRRVARSTIAAETLALMDGIDTATFLIHLCAEVTLITQNSQVVALTDNLSLHEAASTTTLISDRRLRIELSAIREMQDRQEIDLQWIPKEKQLSDVMTKKGASAETLKASLQDGAMSL